MTEPRLFETPAPRETRLLFQAALVLFIITVVIGILNGAGLVDFNHEQLVTHVHAGTLGWITLALFATTIWLFAPRNDTESDAADDVARSATPAWLPWAAITSISLFIGTFLIGLRVELLRPIVGTVVLAVIVAMIVWTIRAAKNVTMTVPHFGLIMSLITLLIGSILGVLLGLKLAGKPASLPDGIAGGHPSMQVIGYLVLAAASVIEAFLITEPKALKESKPGMVQVGLLFLAGIAVSVGVTFNIVPIAALNIPLELAAVIIFISRLRSNLFKGSWLDGTGKRLFSAAGVFLLFNIGLTVYLVAWFISHEGQDPPQYLMISLDHSMFVGVMTNVLFGVAYAVTRLRASVWKWADHVVFWLLNIGAAAWVATLLAQQKSFYKFVTPVMGIGILVGIALYIVRLADARDDTSVQIPEEASIP